MERALEMIWEDIDLSQSLQIITPESQFPFVKEEWYTNTCSILVHGLKTKQNKTLCALMLIYMP